MDLIVMILAAMSGALIGSSTGIFLMYRKLRPVNAVEMDALRSKVRTTEYDLNTAIANGLKLKKEVAEQASKVDDAVVERQKQLDAAVAAKDLEAAHRNAAEQRIAELIAEADARKARQAEIEAKAKELEAKAAELAAKGGEGPSPASEEQQKQLAAFQAQVETGGRQIQELTEQVARLAAEGAGLKQHSEEAEKTRIALEADLQRRSEEAEKMQMAFEAELKQRWEEAEKTRIALEVELKQRWEEAEKTRMSLEGDLMSERERLHVLTDQVSELRSELSAQDVQMQEERGSAAKRMELLVMAQQNLSRVIQAAAEAPASNGGNGGNGHCVVAGAISASKASNGHNQPQPAQVEELLAVAAQ